MILAWLRLLRPAQWVKNLFVLAPLLFARHLFDLTMALRAGAAFLLFCLLSSSVYILNDVLDREKDRQHPLKSQRPIAAGVIPVNRAVPASLVLAGLCLAAAFVLDVEFGAIGAGYLAANWFYSGWLKRVAFVDVGVIAAGFVFRVVGGALAIEVEFSVWLVVCTFCLASLLGFGKRRHELEILQDATPNTRPALAGYSRKSLRMAEWILAAITLGSYLFYTLAPGTVAKFHTYNLVWTLPFPVFGILRYLHLAGSQRRKVPTEALVTDVPTLLNLAGWVAVVILVLYDVG